MQNSYNIKILSMAGQGGSMFGVYLPSIMDDNKQIMALSSDMSTPAGLDKFKTAYPNNFINVGIAEQNMIGIATGLTDEGYKTVSVAQACFISMRSFEQIRQYLGYMHSNQILVGIGSGFSLSFMGNTHYALEDIALMKIIPNMTVIAPSDSLQAVKAFEAALNYDSPVYIRLFGGTNIPIIYQNDLDYNIGKAIQLREGNDIQLIATGSMVGVAVKVAENLAEKGLSVSVTDMHTIKPMDYDAIGLDKKLIVSIEEHFDETGLGSSISDYLSGKEGHPMLLKCGVENRYGIVGNYSYLLEKNRLTENDIVNKILSNYKS